MTIHVRGRSLARRTGAGALVSTVVASLLLVAQPSPAGAATVTVGPGDLKGSETPATYASWHQGYDNAALRAAVTKDGLQLSGQSQIIKGYTNNNNADLATGGVNANVTSLIGASYNVTAGAAYFQLPLFVDLDNNAETAGTFTTLRPAAAATTNDTIEGTDQWVSSKALGDIAANTPVALSTLVTAVNAHKSKTLAFGVLTDIGASATVASITFNGDTYNFENPVVPVTVTNDDVKPEETSSNYADWHQGYENATARQQVNSSGLVLAGESQVIKGYSNNSNTLNVVNANLQFEIPKASYTVAAGSDPVFFQIPVFYDNGSGVKFTTLRNGGKGAGVNNLSLSDSWQSSKALGDIDANTDAPLSAIIAALGSYKTLGVGVLTNPGTTGTVSKIVFGNRDYTFADAGQATGSTEVVRARDIAPNENTYAGWHQGAAGGTATVAQDGTVLDLGATKSQVIKGYANNSNNLDARNVNLVDALTNASYTVVSGKVYFQVPLFVEDPSTGDTVFTTLRPAAPGATGTNKVNVGQQWVSSKTVGGITANEPVLLGDILSTFKTYKVLAFGVFSDTGDNGKVSDITWNGVKYTFTGNRSPIPISNLASTSVGTTVTVPLTGSDPDGDPLTYAVASQPTHGTASITGSTLTYTPTPGFVGRDTVFFNATDGQGGQKLNARIVVSVNKVRTTTLGLTSALGAGGKTVVRFTPKVPTTALGASVEGARIIVLRSNGQLAAIGNISGGTVKLTVGKLPSGRYLFKVLYGGTATTAAATVPVFVTVQ